MAQQGKPLGSMIIDIGLDGSKMTKSLDGIKRQIRAAQSEMKAHMSVISQAGNGYKTMEAKVNGLTKVMASNEKQIEVLHEKYEQAKKDFGENSKQAQKYATQINNAVAKQSAMQKQLEDAELAMRDFKRGTQDTRVQIDQVARSVSAQVSALKEQGREYASSKAELKGLSKQHKLQTELVEKEKEKLQDLIKTKGEDARETREQQVVVEEAISNQKIMAKRLEELNSKVGGVGDSFIDAADNLNNFSERMQVVSDNLKTIGRDLTAKITAPLVGLGAIAAKTGSDFDSSMSYVQAVSGSTGEDLEKLRQKAREMGASTTKSATEAADAIGYMALAGWNTKQMMGGVEPVLRLSEAAQIDLARASDLVTDSMSAMGIKTEELPGFLDAVAQASRKANTNVDALMEAFLVTGGTLSNFKVPVEETSALLAILANRGYKGSEAGTAMNAIFTNLTSGMGQAGKALEKLNISAFDSQGNFIGLEKVLLKLKDKLSGMTEEQQAQYISMIAGKEHLKTFQALMNGLGEEYQDVKKSIENSDGALNEMSKTMNDNVKGDALALKSAIEELALQLNDILSPYIRTALQGLTALAQNFGSLDEKTKIAIVGFSGVAAAIPPLIWVAGTLAGSISNITSLASSMALSMGKLDSKIGGTKKIMGGLQLAFAAFTSPVGLVVAGIAALVAGFVLAYNKSETFRNFINGIGEAIKNMIPPEVIDNIKSFIDGAIQKFNEGKELAQQAFGVVADFIQSKITEVKAFWDENGAQILQAFSNIFNGIKVVVTTVFSTLLAVIQPIWNTITSLFQSSLPYILQLFQFIFSTVLAVVQSVWENIKGVISGALDVIMGVIKIFSGLFTGDFSKMWEGIKQVFFGAINLIWNWMQLMFWGKLLKGLTAFGGLFKGLFSGIWGGIKTIFSTVIGWIVNFVKGSFTRIASTTKGIFNGIKSFFSWIWGSINGVFSSFINIIVNFVRTRFTNLRNNVTAIFNGIRNVTQTIWSAIKDFVIKPVMNIVSRVGSLFSGLRKTIGNIFNGIKDKVVGIFNTMVDAIKRLPQRMADGLKKNAGRIASGVKAVSKFLLEGLAKGVNGVTGGINWILDKVHAPKKLRIPKWKIPEYAKGTDNHQGGLAKVSDGKGPNKRELIRLPNGQLFLSPRKETIMNLPKGTSVLDGNSTASLLKGKGIPAYAKGKGILQQAFDTAKSTWNGAKDMAKAGFEKVKSGAVAVWDFAKNPLALIKSAISSFTNLAGVKQPALGMVQGVISKATEGAKKWIQGLLQGGDDVRSSGNPTADVKRWVTRAMDIAGVSGRNWLNGLSLIAMKESGGNPRAQNNWDINAKRGIPSKGLMQTIGPTFNAYKMRGYDNIFNPVHNIIAAIRYIKARYKTIGNVPGVRAVNQGRRYVGYENGGFSFKHKLAEISEGNKPEAIVPLSKAKRGRALQILAKASEVVGFENGSKVTVNNDTSKLEQLLQEQNKLYEQQNAMTQQMLGLLFQLVSKGENSVTLRDLTDMVSATLGKQFSNEIYQQGGF